MFKKKSKHFLSLALSAALLSGAAAAPVQADTLSQGAYVAPCNTYYMNPDTGAIDDGGTKNRDLGEDMCRSAVYESALLEQDGDKTYLTIRMQLMSNIRDIRFSAQQTKGDKDSYKSVSYDTMQEDAAADTADMRMEVPAGDTYIRCQMYVIPMGRDVTYYINADADNAVKGSGDFIVSVNDEPTDTDADANDDADADNGGPDDSENEGRGDTDSGKNGAAEPEQSSPADKFSDLNGHWAKDAAAKVIDRGLFSGTGETSFSPETSMTRAMFVTVIGRFSDVDTAKYTESSFSDVNADSWYGPYVSWASASDLVNGTGGGQFSPNNAVTQQQLAVLLVRYCEFRGLALPDGMGGTLANQAQSASWAAEAVADMADAGFITDSDGGAFEPAQPATRAQVAAILARFLDYYNI